MDQTEKKTDVDQTKKKDDVPSSSSTQKQPEKMQKEKKNGLVFKTPLDDNKSINSETKEATDKMCVDDLKKRKSVLNEGIYQSGSVRLHMVI